MTMKKHEVANAMKTTGVYLPSFMFRQDEVCFKMWELAGNTHEEAISNLNVFHWQPDQSRLMLLILTLDIEPTGDTYRFGGSDKENAFEYYEGKIDQFPCMFVGGKTFKHLQEQERSNE